jgi:RNA polymerase sigma-70 factor (ECF subfamily)
MLVEELTLEAGASPTARLGELFDAHHRRLYRLGLRLLGNAEEAQDLVQETFLRAAQTLGRVPADEPGAEAWLVRVAVNVARDRQRRHAVRRARAAPLPAQPASPDEEGPRLARWAVRTALRALPARRRAIVVLHELEGLSTGEVARLLGCAPVTVRWHLSSARRELARALGPFEPAPEETP